MTDPTPPTPPTPRPPKLLPDGRPASRDAALSVTCRQCVEFLLDYLDGLLPDDQKYAFESHIALCPECHTFVENYRAAVTLVGRAGRLAAPDDSPRMPAHLVDAILKSLRKDP